MIKKILFSTMLSLLISKGMGMEAPTTTPLETVFKNTPDIGELILLESHLPLKDLFLTSKIFHPTISQMFKKFQNPHFEDLLFFTRAFNFPEDHKATSLDAFYDSTEKELTDDILGRIVETFPNLTSLKLNIIYLSEHGLRQLTKLTHLKTLILECLYTGPLNSLRFKAAEEYRLNYYPERLQICGNILNDFRQEIARESYDPHKFTVAFDAIKKDLLYCNSPKKHSENLNEWINTPYDNCIDYLKKVGGDTLSEQYWKAVAHVLKQKHPESYDPSVMKDLFPIPNFNAPAKNIFKWEYFKPLELLKELEIKKYATLDFGYISENPNLCCQLALDNFIHFYEVVQEPQTLESYNSLLNALFIQDQKESIWENFPVFPNNTDSPYQRKFQSCKGLRRERAQKQQNILASCIYDIVKSNPDLKHLKIPALKHTEVFGGKSSFPTYWFLWENTPNSEKIEMNTIDQLDNISLLRRRNELQIAENENPSLAIPILPFLKKLDVLEFTHPFALKESSHSLDTSQSSLIISIPEDKLLEYINFMEGLIEKTNYIGKIIFNRTYSRIENTKRERDGLHPYETRIPKIFIMTIQSLIGQKRIGSYEIRS